MEVVECGGKEIEIAAPRKFHSSWIRTSACFPHSLNFYSTIYKLCRIRAAIALQGDYRGKAPGRDKLALYTKTCPKLAVFGHFLIFSFFEVPFLGTAFSFIKCGIKYPKWLIYATCIHNTELSNLPKNEIVLRPKHGAPPPFLDQLKCRQDIFFFWFCGFLLWI